jgi:phosphatidylglycerophosphatase A
MNFHAFLASGFGIGYAPKAPGTFGALLGLALGAALLTAGHVPLLFGIIVVTGLGIFAIARLPDQAAADPGWIVIDEIAGQMVPLLALRELSIGGLLVAFILFRVFDIWKPGPVAWADQRHDEFGIMGDDIIAGLLAGAIVLALHLVSPL